MKKKDFSNLIESAALTGRGGAAFPTAKKWRMVKSEITKQKQSACIVINGAEGEPGVFKDGFVLAEKMADVFLGFRSALEYFGPDNVSKIYLFTRRDYARRYGGILEKELNKKINAPIKRRWQLVLKEGHSYISGEESALINFIEFSLAEPRLKPPFPTAHGVFGQPTLVNNLETFYAIGLIAAGTYAKERLYSVTGAVKNPGVFSFLENLTIKQVLQQSNNFPSKEFFVIVGGDMSGEVLNSRQLNKPVSGAGSIRVYPANISPKKVVGEWLEFYANESCGHCTPCREGTYRLLEMFLDNPIDFLRFPPVVRSLMDNLKLSSFCALGASLPVPLESYAANILKIKNKK